MIESESIERKILFFIILLAFLKGILWAAIIPLSRVPDEPGYLQEIIDLARYGRIHSYTGHVVGTFAYTGAFFYKIASSIGLAPWFFVRILGVLCSVVVVAIAFYTTKLLFEQEKMTKFLTPLLVALNPMYSFISASANSDTMLIMWSSLFIFLMTFIVLKGPTLINTGLLLIIGLLGFYTKERFLVLVPLAILAFFAGLILKQLRSRFESKFLDRKISKTELGIGVFFLIIFALSWIPLYNFLFKLTPSLPVVGRVPSINESLRILITTGLGTRLIYEFFGVFDYLLLPMTPAMYKILILIALAGIAGLGVAILKSFSFLNKEKTRERGYFIKHMGLLVNILSIAAAVYATIWYHLKTSGAQGRYVFIAIVPIYILISLGISQLFPKYTHLRVFNIIFALALIVNLGALFYVVSPVYY